MSADARRAELAAAMEAGFAMNTNTGQHCQGLADAYMASLPEGTEERGEYDRHVQWSLEFNPEMSDTVRSFHYLRVKAVRIAMKVAQERGDLTQDWSEVLF